MSDEKSLQKCLEWLPNHKKLFLLLVIMLVILIPCFLDVFIFGNSVKSSLSNGEWAGFLGSYLGGILGGICTLFAVFLTITQNQNQIKKNEELRVKIQLEKYREEQREKFNRIVGETIAFIADVQVFVDINKCYKRKIDEVNSEKELYEKLKYYYDNDRNHFGTRYGNWETYEEALIDANISTDIPEEYKKHYVMFNEPDFDIYKRAYIEFGQYLVKNVNEYKERKDKLDTGLVENKQKLILGNLHYLFLEITLKNDKRYDRLLVKIIKLYETVDANIFKINFTEYLIEGPDKIINECVKDIKEQLKTLSKTI